MTKRKESKLVLNKETVTSLDTRGMGAARGGNDGDPIILYGDSYTTIVPVLCPPVN